MVYVCEILENSRLKGNYLKICFRAPEICESAKPGQFIHARILQLRDRVLRRPFSISNVEKDVLTVIYKVVGTGTEALSGLVPGDTCDIMGPLGNPFSLPGKDELPVIVAGGYGCAAVYMLCGRAPSKGIVLLGARSDSDLLLVDEFKKLGFDTRCATEDGSSGHRGRVTELIPAIIEKNKARKLKFYGCGPQGMLLAMGKMITGLGLDGELSMDHLMCCGIGACFACVIKVKDNNPDGWRYARTCKEGPVFKASEFYYQQEDRKNA